MKKYVLHVEIYGHLRVLSLSIFFRPPNLMEKVFFSLISAEALQISFQISEKKGSFLHKIY